MERRACRNSIIAGVALLFGGFAAEAALVVNPAMPITGLVTVQPIVVSNDNGGNTAEFFGTPSQQNSITGLIDTIWAQAGLDIEFLAPNAWDSTFANGGSSFPRPSSDLGTIVNTGASANVANSDPNVINMYFVNSVPAFGQLDQNEAAGLAFVDGNGIAQFVGSGLLGFAGGLETIAGVVAHEIGHNLGLEHVNAAQNLMGSGGDRLNSAQIANVLDSRFVGALTPTPVPVPAAGWMLLTAVLGLLRRKVPGYQSVRAAA